MSSCGGIATPTGPEYLSHSSSINTDVVRRRGVTRIGGLLRPISTRARLHIRIFNPQLGNRMRPARLKGEGRQPNDRNFSFPYTPPNAMPPISCVRVSVNVIDVSPFVPFSTFVCPSSTTAGGQFGRPIRTHKKKKEKLIVILPNIWSQRKGGNEFRNHKNCRGIFGRIVNQ